MESRFPMTDDTTHRDAWNDEAKILCEFEVRCHKLWKLLDPTPIDDVRYCPECERDVHSVRTQEEYRQHAEQGHCVAVRLHPRGAAERDDCRGVMMGRPRSTLPSIRWD